MKKKIFSILFAVLLILFLKNTCYAANASITCKTDVNVGEKINITVTGSAVQWNLELKVNGETIAKSSEVDNVNGNKSINFSGQYTPTSEGSLNVTLTGTATEASDGSTIRSFESKTINVKKVEEPENNTSNNTGTTNNNTNNNDTNNNTTAKSSEARLSNLGIKPNDFKGFKRDKYEYNVEVPNDVSKVNVYAETIKNSNAKITSGTGNVTLKEGINTVKIVVTAEDGKTTKTYVLNITRKTAEATTDEPEEDDKSTEARLSNLGINPKKYDFSGFKKDIYEYNNIEIPSDVEEIEIYADAVSSKAKIEGTGKVKLKEGENKIEVKVTAEDGKATKTYVLNITRVAATEEPEEQSNEDQKEILGLTSLLVKNVNLSPKFDPEVYEYTIGVTEDLTSLDIQAKANNSKATIEIIGNEKLKNGENIITILISNSETEENATYQIIVNKNVIIKDEVSELNWLNPSTYGTREKIIIGIAIVLIMIIIVAIVMKVKFARQEEEDFDLPGGYELDRALTEHQELADDAEDYNNIEEKSDIEMAQEYFETYSKRKGKHF